MISIAILSTQALQNIDVNSGKIHFIGLLSFILKQFLFFSPNPLLVFAGVFVNLFFIAYILSPRFCHRFVGYLEEEAVKTYTYCLKVISFMNFR